LLEERVAQDPKSEIRNPKSESIEQTAISDFGFRISDLNIFLIGYRCTGKTTIARLMAERLGRNWLDADAVLEQCIGRSIRALFAEAGESAFRDKEEVILHELCQLRRYVIATGGGVILRATNRERLRASGKVVWLTADAQTIWQRLQADAGTSEHRPTLTVGGLAEIEQLLRERESLYRVCADVVVETTGRTPGEVVEAVMTQLEQ
jgi:shikimate kinase